MLYQIVYLLLDVTVGLVAGMCVLRAYMQFQRIPMSVRAGNPAGPFIFALSDWIVLPLRRAPPLLTWPAFWRPLCWSWRSLACCGFCRALRATDCRCR